MVANHNSGLLIHNSRGIATMAAMERKRKFRQPVHRDYRCQRLARYVRRGMSGIAGDAMVLRRRRRTVGAIATG
jgi:hypothetical protein